MNSYAGFWRRTGAFGLDYILILLYMALLALIGFLIYSQTDAFLWLFADRVRAQISGFLLLTLPVILYFALSEASPQKATWGKRRMKLQVTDDRGERMNVGRSLVRTALKFIPWEISHTFVWTLTFSGENVPGWVNACVILVYALIGINLASLLFTKRHQTVYDLLAGTYVTRHLKAGK